MFFQNPEAQVAITHDDDWIRMLEKVLVTSYVHSLTDVDPGVIAQIPDAGKRTPRTYSERTRMGRGL